MIVEWVLGKINDIGPKAALRDIGNVKSTCLRGSDIADAVAILSDFSRVMVAFLMNSGMAAGSRLSDDCVIAVADLGNIGTTSVDRFDRNDDRRGGLPVCIALLTTIAAVPVARIAIALRARVARRRVAIAGESRSRRERHRQRGSCGKGGADAHVPIFPIQKSWPALLTNAGHQLLTSIKIGRAHV